MPLTKLSICAAIAVLCAVTPDGDTPYARVSTLAGDVALRRAGAAKPLRLGEELYPGDLLFSANGYAVLCLYQSGGYEVYPDSVHLLKRAPNSLIDPVESALAGLKSAALSRKRPNSNRMRTPSAVIAVRG